MNTFQPGTPSTKSCALFWDIASRPQPEQTNEEIEMGQRALAVMSSFYASVAGTSCLSTFRLLSWRGTSSISVCATKARGSQAGSLARLKG